MKQWVYLRHLLSAFLLMFAYSLITSAINLMVLPVVNYFSFSRGAFTLGTTLLMIPSLLLSPFLGSFVDRFGLRRMLLVGSLWFPHWCSGFPTEPGMRFAVGSGWP